MAWWNSGSSSFGSSWGNNAFMDTLRNIFKFFFGRSDKERDATNREKDSQEKEKDAIKNNLKSNMFKSREIKSLFVLEDAEKKIRKLIDDKKKVLNAIGPQYAFEKKNIYKQLFAKLQDTNRQILAFKKDRMNAEEDLKYLAEEIKSRIKKSKDDEIKAADDIADIKNQENRVNFLLELLAGKVQEKEENVRLLNFEEAKQRQIAATVIELRKMDEAISRIEQEEQYDIGTIFKFLNASEMGPSYVERMNEIIMKIRTNARKEFQIELDEETKVEHENTEEQQQIAA